MRLLSALVCGLLLVVGGTAPRAAELVMFESEGCPWCRAWDQEVGRIYAKTKEAEVLPLRRVPLNAPRPADLQHVRGILYTPTFVILEQGVEVGRIQGYPGEDAFWWQLSELIGRLERLRKVGFPPRPPVSAPPGQGTKERQALPSGVPPWFMVY